MTATIDLLETLRGGLPTSDGPRRHVVIVGAGMRNELPAVTVQAR